MKQIFFRTKASAELDDSIADPEEAVDVVLERVEIDFSDFGRSELIALSHRGYEFVLDANGENHELLVLTVIVSGQRCGVIRGGARARIDDLIAEGDGARRLVQPSSGSGLSKSRILV